MVSAEHDREARLSKVVSSGGMVSRLSWRRRPPIGLWSDGPARIMGHHPSRRRPAWTSKRSGRSRWTPGRGSDSRSWAPSCSGSWAACSSASLARMAHNALERQRVDTTLARWIGSVHRGRAEHRPGRRDPGHLRRRDHDARRPHGRRRHRDRHGVERAPLQLRGRRLPDRAAALPRRRLRDGRRRDRHRAGGRALRHHPHRARQRADDRGQQQDLLGHHPELLGEPVPARGAGGAAGPRRRSQPGHRAAEGAPGQDPERADDAARPTWRFSSSRWPGPVLAVRPYCNNTHYWQVYFDTNRIIREAFGTARFPVPQQHLRVQSYASTS